MKIISLYVENFGCLHEFNYAFHEGLNVIYSENGSGKTTLANFIKAMFYGFSGRGKSVDDNDRLKYAPWQGGVFGGNLVFETDKRYKIERTFGKKESEDEFRLLDVSTGRELDGTSLGEKLFSLNANGFERCIYMPQKRIEGLDEDLIAKLNGAISSENEVSFAKAIDILDKTRASIKRKGGKGEYFDLSAHLGAIQSEIVELTPSVTKRDENNAEIAQSNGECLRLEREISKMPRYNKQDLINIKSGEIATCNEKYKKVCAELAPDITEERAREYSNYRLKGKFKSIPLFFLLALSVAGLIAGIAGLINLENWDKAVFLLWGGLAVFALCLVGAGIFMIVKSDSAFYSLFNRQVTCEEGVSILREYLSLLDELRKKKQELSSLELSTEDGVAQKLQNELRNKREKLIKLQTENVELDKDAQKLYSLRVEEREIQSKLSECEQTLEDVELTIKYLRIANDNLTEKYLAPLTEKLNEYMSYIKPVQSEGMSIDADFKMSFDRRGIARGEEYFSRGERDCFNLCLRLAIAGTLSKNLPIILDDPFSSLDEKSFAQVKNVLIEIGKTSQILYFVCHKSRM